MLPVRAAWTELGIGATGSKSVGKSGQLTYQGYVVNGAILDFTIEKVVEAEDGQSIQKLASEAAVTRGPVNGEEGVRAGTWRVGYSPTLTTDFGFSGYTASYTPDFLEVDDADHRLRRRRPLEARGLCPRRRIHPHRFWRHRPGRAGLHRHRDRLDRHSAAGRRRRERRPSSPSRISTPSRHGFWLEGPLPFLARAWKNTFLGKGFDDPHLSCGRSVRARHR